MKSVIKRLPLLITGFIIISLGFGFTPSGSSSFESENFEEGNYIAFDDSTGDDTLQLPYPFPDNPSDGYSNPGYQSPMFLNNPSNIQSNIVYDPEFHEYNITETIGDRNFRNPNYMTFNEFYRNEFKNSTQEYWRQKSEEDSYTGRKRSIPKLYVGGEAFDRIFGGNTVDIRPQGSAELIFGINISRNNNPQIPEKQRRTSTFDFRERIQMNVIGNIGEKLRTSINYNTEATFDFENKMKLDYTGKEDEIIKKIEAGNVSLPLTGSLIQGSQSLFGLKTKLQFGRMTVTTIFSQQKSETKTINVAPGGAQTQEFDIKGDNYEANKHFFLAQYFRDNYDDALAQLPIIQSGVSITKIEVWITNRTSTTNNTRNIVSFMDLSEIDPYNTNIVSAGGSFPDNGNNSLYNQIIGIGTAIRDIATINTNAGIAGIPGNPYTSPIDYEKLENARMLNPNEYTYNGQLGYISLQSALNADEVLSVAFEYTANGQVYKVGELTTDGINPPQVLITKMLKSTNTNPRLPTWKLMMKNIYALGAFQVSATDFRLDVLYEDDATGSVLNFLPTGKTVPNINGKPLIKVLRLDNLNTQRDPQPDGLFDFIEGITINSANGRIIFPVVEPFGEFLREEFGTDPSAQQLANKYVFEALYDSSLSVAQQQPERNKYRLKGEYQSQSSSEIQLNSFNIPRGSVVVTAGGIPLIENQQYTVDYNLGRVKIIDQSILNSNTPISVKLEDESLFSIQSKTLMGAHFDYDVAKDFTLGATIMRLSERPITRKVNIGDEPIANTIWGIDGTYNTESRFLTKLVDKLPFIDTKEPSTVTVTGEFAHLIPGHAKAIGKNGVAYIDDFEGSQTFIDLKNIGTWFLSSTPQGQSGLFPEAGLIDSVAYGFNRSKLAWYIVDNLFYSDNSLRPSHITSADVYDNRVRQILEQEIFPNADNPNGIPPIMPMFDIAYYPAERGPFNYDALASPLSAGTALDGTLNNPESRWAGITRRLETTDFEEANIEFIQFWIMDPFHSDEPNSFNEGELYFNLGNISEDVLRDSRKAFENGLPTPNNNAPVDMTAWGVVPVNQSLVPAFDNDAGARDAQDVGLDGLSSQDEIGYYQDFLNDLNGNINPNAFTNISADVSSDNFKYYRGDDLDAAQASILERYKKFNGTEGNSPVATGSISASATNVPDGEDINRDNTMSESESYYQYKVAIRPNMEIGSNFITDKVTRTVVDQSGNNAKQVTWYQFKIPVTSPTSVINGISDFKSIRFMRMFLKEFEDPVVIRFARLELVRGEWRKYPFDLLTPGEYITVEDNSTLFDVSTVNLEENGDRSPIPYVIPPGIDREVNVGTSNLQKLNEQSLSLKVCNLEDGDARAGYKITEFDILNYKRIKMFVHAESSDDAEKVANGDIRLFIRLGSDFVSNYYEYEIPLLITPSGTTDPELIWPADNELDIDLESLVNAKLQRDKSNAQINAPFTVLDGNRRITISGTPNLANIKTIMLGIRNPKRSPDRPLDDGQAKCAEVWVNELRLTDFEEKGGWAANARVTAKLASLGTVTLSGNRKTIGFGSIEQTLNERSRSNDIGYELSAQLKLDEFLPENTGLSVPMYFGYSEQFSNPQYNPLQPDVELEKALDEVEDREDLKKKAVDYTKRKSLNFTNVRKNKVNPTSKSHIYDISNFDFTYAFSETYHRDINTEFDVIKTYKGAIGYNYNQAPKSYTPFQNSIGSSKALRPVKDFNFSLRPTSLSFRTDLDRQYGERLLRNNTDFVAAIDTTFNKFFNWSRQYGMQWDLTKSVKFDFNANNQARVDEPRGRIDTKSERDSILTNIKNFGRNTNYNHQGNATYNVPLNKFPFLNFINLSTKYGFDYSWNAAPLTRNDLNQLEPNSFGNTIQNSNTKQINASLSMPTLYNKLPFYRNLNKPRSKAVSSKSENKPVSKLSKAAKDSLKAAKKNEPKQLSPVVKRLISVVFSVKNISVNYSETNGTSLPGYIRDSEILGMDLATGSPGIPFILGSQKDIRFKAANNRWLSEDTLLNVQYSKNFQQNLTGRANIEPIPGFRIDLNANRSFARTNTEYFRSDPQTGEFNSFSPLEQGNFSMSYLTWNTAFVSESVDFSELFQKFDQNRLIISNRLANNNINSTGLLPADSTGIIYREGYSGTQQEVLLYSFLAAYTDNPAQGIKLDQFPNIPLPNWRITYDGIGKMKWAKKIFRNVNISHGYRSSYNINSFTTDVNYREDFDGNSIVKDNAGINFLARNEMTQVTVSEQFSPLVGVEVTLKNSLSLRADYKQDRNLSLTFTGIQLTEVKGKELTIGAGYRFKDFKLPFSNSKRDATGSDLNLTADISYRSNETIIRKMIEQTNQITAGLEVLSIKTSADYAVNERFNVRFFFDHTVNTPKISLSYPTSNTNAGISIRFTLSQ